MVNDEREKLYFRFCLVFFKIFFEKTVEGLVILSKDLPRQKFCWGYFEFQNSFLFSVALSKIGQNCKIRQGKTTVDRLPLYEKDFFAISAAS